MSGFWNCNIPSGFYPKFSFCLKIFFMDQDEELAARKRIPSKVAAIMTDRPSATSPLHSSSNFFSFFSSSFPVTSIYKVPLLFTKIHINPYNPSQGKGLRTLQNVTFLNTLSPIFFLLWSGNLQFCSSPVSVLQEASGQFPHTHYQGRSERLAPN